MFLHECRCKTFCGTRVVFANHASKFPSSLSSGLLERFFELLFGFLLINPKTRFIAGWGIIFVMITVFPANLYLAVNDGAVMGISKELAWGRLPFQYVFIGLAYWHAQRLNNY